MFLRFPAESNVMTEEVLIVTAEDSDVALKLDGPWNINHTCLPAADTEVSRILESEFQLYYYIYIYVCVCV